MLKALRGRHDVRALLLPGEDEQAVRDLGLQPVHGDLADRASSAAAFDGVERLFLLSPFVEGHEKLEHNALDLAEQAGVARVVKLAYAGIDWPIAITAGQREIEQRLADAPFETVRLHSEVYASNLLTQAQSIKDGQLVLPAPRAQVGYVDPADVGAVAAVLLTQPSVPSAPVVLTGPEPLTNDEVAAIASDVLGREVRAASVPGDAWAAAVTEAGVPAFIAQAVAEMHETIESEGPITPTDTIEQLLGREPRSVRDFLTRTLN